MNFGLILQIAAVVILVIGLGFSYFQRKPSIFTYATKIQNIISELKGDNYSDKTRVTLKPLAINVPNSNPEIGHDSEYELNIITPHPIADFSLKVKMPDSLWEPKEMFSLYNDPIGGERAWYSYKIENGYALFKIPNAAGEYHLTFGNIKPEVLTITDISW